MSINTSIPISKITYNDVEIPLSSGSSGFNITFPATASRWTSNTVGMFFILFSNGTYIDIGGNYSQIANQTLTNVIGIYFTGHSTNAPRLSTDKSFLAVLDDSYQNTFSTYTELPLSYSLGPTWTIFFFQDCVITSIGLEDTE